MKPRAAATSTTPGGYCSDHTRRMWGVMATNSELPELRHRFSRSVTCQERTGKPR